MTGEGAFYNCNQLLALRKERRNKQENQDDVNDEKLKELVAYIDSAERLLILRAKKHRCLA